MRRNDVAPALAVLTFSLTSATCFDVHAVDPGPAVLDDFEDGDLIPSLRPFGAWSCVSYYPSTKPFDCTIGEGFQGSAGLSAAFSIVDPPDGNQQRATVQVETFAGTPIDLTGSSVITFDVRLTNAPVATAGGANMRLQLACSTAIGENGAAPGDFVVIQAVPYTAEWASVSMTISNFGAPIWLPGVLQGGAPACLRAVDGFQLAFDPALPDGQALTGVLSLDNVRLR